MQYLRYSATALGLLLAASSTARAVELEPVVVTATRTAQTADETLAAVSVLTRKDIERRQAQSVPELLHGLAGVNIDNNGGPGKTSSLFLRGTESDHVLVLIDGIKVGSATVGSAALQLLPIDQIERIEVVRGPRSSLYGSEAIGGVIQIFTRKGGGALRPFFSLGGGSDQTYSAGAGVAGGGERGWFSAGLEGFGTQGFDACYGSDSAGCFTVEPDDDSHRSLAGSLRAGYRFENGAEVDFHALRADGETDFDGGFVNETETVQQVFGASARFSPSAWWQVGLSAGRSEDQSDNFKDGAFQTRFDTERDTFSLQNDFSIGDAHLATLGLDYQDDKVDSATEYVETSRDNQGVFGQYLTTLGRHDLEFSLRHDDNAQFGTHTTGGVAWGFAPRGGLRLTAAYGTAFKAPTFNDLYFPDYGNPDLKPEEAASVELGVRGETGWGAWSVNAYRTEIDNLIGFDAAAFAPGNVDESRIRGVEGVLSTQLAQWALNTYLTWQDPKNQSSGPNQGNLLARRAEHSLRMDVDRDFKKFSLGATLNGVSKRYDDLASTHKLGAYATLDLRAEYAFSKALRLQARLTNVFDRDYETAAFYNQPGRDIFIALRYRP